ncbi:terminase [Candidatus Woesearchaeota archaeon]|jgi:hypothetical protein|nr:terminase [Candidatus Woesearchaeota archaeon]
MIEQKTYLGNPLLKGAYVHQDWSEKQVGEYIRCQQDPIYFIAKHLKIVSLDEGLVDFDLRPYQKDMIEKFYNERFVICKMARQSGKSTTILAYLLHYILFNENVNVAILANKKATAMELLGRLQLAYEHLPKWLQQGILIWNKGNIELENGSKILASSTSGSAIRGGSFNIIFLDEFAFVPSNISEEFFSSVYPTITSGKSTKMFIVSTPNGMNMFYKLWTDAEEGNNDYVPISVHWSQVPGRDDEWKQKTIRNTSERQFEAEFECSFLGSSNTLISTEKLMSMPFKKPIYQYDGLDIYQEPIMNHTYVIVCDVARGVGLDYSAFSIFDVTKQPYRQVGKYRKNDISPMLYPNVIFTTARKYNEAFILVEVNDIGQQVADILYHDMEYENMMMVTMHGRNGQQIGGGFSKNVSMGIRTTKQVKRIGCATLKDLIERDNLLIEDFDTISELTTFIGKSTSWEADDGAHDDLVMGCVLFSWLVQQRYFKELTDQDIREKMFAEQMKMIEEDMVPFGIINDGNDPDEFQIPGDDNIWKPITDKDQYEYF